jgi:hypothetical protein
VAACSCAECVGERSNRLPVSEEKPHFGVKLTHPGFLIHTYHPKVCLSRATMSRDNPGLRHEFPRDGDLAVVIVRRDLLSNPENQTTKPPRHEEVKNNSLLSLCVCAFAVHSLIAGDERLLPVMPRRARADGRISHTRPVAEGQALGSHQGVSEYPWVSRPLRPPRFQKLFLAGLPGLPIR